MDPFSIQLPQLKTKECKCSQSFPIKPLESCGKLVWAVIRQGIRKSDSQIGNFAQGILCTHVGHDIRRWPNLLTSVFFLQRKNGLIFFKTEKSWGWNKRWQDVFFWEWTLWPQQGVACKKWKGWVWTRRKGEFGNFHFDFFLWNWGKIHFTSYPNTRHPQVFHWKIGYSWVSFNSKLFELRRRFKTIKDKDSAVVRRTTIFEALRWCMVRTWEESHEDETHT